jgi:DNA end-binding protein Ku
MLSDDEIAAAADDRAHQIELAEFVVTDEVDPVMFDRTYYLGAHNEQARGRYRLLHGALAKSGRSGIGRWVFHNREYLVVDRVAVVRAGQRPGRRGQRRSRPRSALPPAA